MNKKLSVILSNNLGEIEELFYFMNEFFSQVKIFNEKKYYVNLILEEIVTNTIIYGYKDKKEHEISIDLSIIEEKIFITIVDDAAEFDIVNYPIPELSANVRERKEGGLGIYLIKQLSEELSYQRISGKNIMKIVVNLSKKSTKNIDNLNTKISNDILKQNELPVFENSNSNILKKQVLIVEDDFISIKLVQAVSREICNLDIAYNASEAISKATNKLYDVILMDINLGDSENGIYATKEIRKIDLNKNTPIIAMTAYASLGDKEDFLQNGCTDYLPKPYENKKLLSLIKKYTGID